MYLELGSGNSFNSIKVRLKHKTLPTEKCLQLFQFHKGAIETVADLSKLCSTLLFQFHKGAIETQAVCTAIQFVVAFNSIKVRLKLAGFQPGTMIETTFNSIKVRLKRRYVQQMKEPPCAFNSIKVRLKPVSALGGMMEAFFQFHKGAIETLTPMRVLIFLPSFNSIKVRLKL